MKSSFFGVPNEKRWPMSAQGRHEGGEVAAQYSPAPVQLVRSPGVHVGPLLELPFEPLLLVVELEEPPLPVDPVRVNGCPHPTPVATIRRPVKENVKLRMSARLSVPVWTRNPPAEAAATSPCC